MNRVSASWIFIIWIALQNYGYAQTTPLAFNYSTAFSDSAKLIWPTRNEAQYESFIADNKYQLSSKEEEGKVSFLIPQLDTAVVDHHIIAKFTDVDADEDGNVGISFALTRDGRFGYALQLGRRDNWRVCQWNGAKMIPISGSPRNNGWISLKGNKANTIALEVKEKGGTFQIFIDKELLFTRNMNSTDPGWAFGLVISDVCKANCTFFSVSGNRRSRLSGAGIDSLSVPKDVAGLNKALYACRREVIDIEADWAQAEERLVSAKQRIAQLEDFITNNLDKKLQAEVGIARQELISLNSQIVGLEKENILLEALRRNVLAGKDGDIILILSNNLDKAKLENEQLKKRIAQLEAMPKPTPRRGNRTTKP